MRIPDSKIAQFADLIEESGILSIIEAELARRPGPAGLPIRTVLVALLLAINYVGKASIAEASRLLAFSLSPTARAMLDLNDIVGDTRDQPALPALSRRLYRAFDRLTSLTDPARADRRRRLPQAEANRLATAWHDNDLGHLATRKLLQDIVTALVLAPVRRAVARGHLRYWDGDVGIDATAIACWARPASQRKGLASIEITAGWHHSAGNHPPTFGHSATLAVAARRRVDARGSPRHRSHPQMALGLVLDTPHKRIGPDAITVLKGIADLGLPVGLLAVDRAYTGQKPEHFAHPARELGYQLVLDYKQNQRGVQGSVHGAPLIDGNLACPLIPAPLAHATTGLDDQTVRGPDHQLTALIAAREPYYLKLKQGPDKRGAIRLQCPGAGTSPALTCPRFNRLHPHAAAPAGRPAPIDLADPRQRAAHPAAKPTVILPTQADPPTASAQSPPTHLPPDHHHPPPR